MLKEMTDVWACDLCGAEVTTNDGDLPVGWWEVGFVRLSSKEADVGNLSAAKMDEPWDICSKACLEKAVAESAKLIAEMPSPAPYCVLTFRRREPKPEPPPESLPDTGG